MSARNTMPGGRLGGRGVVYLASLGRPTVIGLRARPAVLVAGKSRRGMFLSLLFLHFHSCSSFFPVLPFYLLYYLFSPFVWETA